MMVAIGDPERRIFTLLLEYLPHRKSHYQCQHPMDKDLAPSLEAKCCLPDRARTCLLRGTSRETDGYPQQLKTDGSPGLLGRMSMWEYSSCGSHDLCLL